jgi:AcrR family transcriptional regulator
MTSEPIQTRRSLPRGQHALPREVVAEVQRARILDGIVRAVAEKGYAAATVADAIKIAGVSRSTFYEYFSDKEDCFLAAYEQGAVQHFQRVVDAGAGASDDPFERFRASIRAYLEGLAEDPEYAHTFLVEILAAGPRAREYRRRAHRRYEDLIRAWHAQMQRQRPELRPLPDEVFEAAVTAGNELVAEPLREGGAGRLPGLERLIVYTYFALLGLHDEARAVLDGD